MFKSTKYLQEWLSNYPDYKDQIKMMDEISQYRISQLGICKSLHEELIKQTRYVAIEIGNRSRFKVPGSAVQRLKKIRPLSQVFGFFFGSFQVFNH